MISTWTCHIPALSSDTSTTEGSPLIAAMVQRRADRARDRETTDHVAERRLRRCGPLRVGRREDVLHPAARPVGASVIAAASGVGASRTERCTSYVDQRGVVGADVDDVDPKGAPSVRPQVRHEYVGRLEKQGQEPPAVGVLEVNADRLLAPVGGLELRVDAAVQLVQTGGHQTPVGIARHRMFDLYDVGPPLGEDRAGHRDEHMRGDLDDANTDERCGHRSLASSASPQRRTRRVS